MGKICGGGEFYGDFYHFFREFSKIFSRNTGSIPCCGEPLSTQLILWPFRRGSFNLRIGLLRSIKQSMIRDDINTSMFHVI